MNQRNHGQPDLPDLLDAIGASAELLADPGVIDDVIPVHRAGSGLQDR